MIRFQGYRKDCRVCPLKGQCLRNPNQQEGRQVSFYPKMKQKQASYIDRMTRLSGTIWRVARRVSLRNEANNEKIDSPMGRHFYSERLMYCLVHNIEKIATQGGVVH